MKKKLLLFAMLFTCANGFATIHIINFVSFSYNPNNLTANVGDTIRWSGSFSTHPLASTAVPSGAATFSNGSGSTFDYALTEAGTYSYVCQNHGSMTGVIVAMPASGIDILGENDVMPIIISDHDFIHITIPQQLHSDFTVEVVSLLGSLVYSGTIKYPKQDLDINKRSMLQGVYFVRVEGLKKVYGKKIAITQ